MRTALLFPVLATALVFGLTSCKNDDDDTAATPPGNIPQEAQAKGYTSLVNAVGTAGLATTLSGTGPFTVFAPSNAAFNAVSTLTATFTPAQLSSVLTYHVLSGNVGSAAALGVAAGAGEATTVNGAKVYLDVVGGSLYVNQAKAGPLDVPASNGVIHGLDAVITPPNNVYATLSTYGLTSLKGAVDTAGLASALTGSGTFTVFAPTNAAFSAVSSTTATLTPTQLGNVLKYHVLTSTVKASTAITVAGGSSNQILTLLGGSDKVTLTVPSGVLKVNAARVTLFNIRCTNGVIHVIDAVLIPSPTGIG